MGIPSGFPFVARRRSPGQLRWLELLEVKVNCEQNSLVFRVRPRWSGICHTSNRNDEPRNCFYRRLDLDTLELENMNP